MAVKFSSWQSAVGIQEKSVVSEHGVRDQQIAVGSKQLVVGIWHLAQLDVDREQLDVSSLKLAVSS